MSYVVLKILHDEKMTYIQKCESRADINSCLLTAAGTLAVSTEDNWTVNSDWSLRLYTFGDTNIFHQ